mgnify:CR=1 FL=1
MYTTLSKKEISLGKKIAKGGEGEVYEILGNSDNCIKIYHKHLRSDEKEEKIKYMVANPPSDLQGINYKICWAKDVIYKEGEFVGFMMPKAFDDSLLPYHLCQPVIPKKLDKKWHNTFDRETFKGKTSRLKLSVNIVAAVNRIHNTKKYVIVDLKPQNLLVTALGKVSIIDMDSVQIVENKKILFKAPVSTPEYTPPEAVDIIKSKIPIEKDWDTFSLGVLVYEILCGIHPYVGSAKPPYDNLNTIQEKIKENLTHVTKGETIFLVLPPLHKMFNEYSKDLKNIFKRIFCPYKVGVTVRPSLEEFGETLFNSVVLLEEEVKKEKENRLQQERAKKKLEDEEAIRNYKKITSELESFKIENENLKEKLKEKESNSNSTLVPILVILLLIFMILFIYNYTANNKKNNENNFQQEQYEDDVFVSKYNSLTLENNSSQRIYIAIGYVNCDLEYHYSNKKSIGWYPIESGKELTLDLISLLEEEKYYKCGKLWLYAENDEQSLRWSGNKNNNHFILHNNEKFNYKEWISPANRSKDIRKEIFFEIQLEQDNTRQRFSD